MDMDEVPPCPSAPGRRIVRLGRRGGRASDMSATAARFTVGKCKPDDRRGHVVSYDGALPGVTNAQSLFRRRIRSSDKDAIIFL